MDANLINGNTLAFIGDAYYSLMIRKHLVEIGNQKSNTLQKLSIGFVSAKAQAHFLKLMEDENILNEKEWEIVKRGRNAKSNSIAKNADVITYKNATGFEALFGYLYLNNEETRLKELMDFIIERKD